MLSQNTDKTLNRTKLRRVDHNRFTVVSVRSCVLESETVRLVEVVLNSRHLPGTTDCILCLNRNLRAVECSTARIGNGLQTGLFCAATQNFSRFFPLFIRADELILLLSIGIAGGKLQIEIAQPKVP